MSSSLYWKPVVPVTSYGGYGHPLKGVIARKFFDHDGSLSSGPITFTDDDIRWLEGARDAFEKDEHQKPFNELIAAIQHHGAISIWIEN